jgi:RIP metalloprotease rseP
MEGEEERSENAGSFSQASIPKRIAIVVAGATVNIIFGLLVYFILMSTSNTYVTNEVNSVINGYVAQEIGIQQNDKIIEINGKKIKSKYDLNKIMNKSDGSNINLKIERNGNIQEYNIKPTEIKNKSTGIYLDQECKILTVEKGSSAEKSGLKANDKIIKINNQEINGDYNKIFTLIQEKGTNTILITVDRKGKEISIELTPDYVSSYYLGVNLKQSESKLINYLIYGGIETKEFALSIIDNIKMIFTGGVSIDQMMGPVGISEVVAKTNGFKEFIYMLALISLSLGVTNLLPIPALDGGKILILIIEAIRRKPLKEKTEINIQLIGFSILIALSLYITYNDILRIF